MDGEYNNNSSNADTNKRSNNFNGKQTTFLVTLKEHLWVGLGTALVFVFFICCLACYCLGRYHGMQSEKIEWLEEHTLIQMEKNNAKREGLQSQR